MVDFQLKLQDNKVAEWSDRYMNYAALKKLLKTAKIAEKNYLDLCLLYPSKAEQTTKAYRSGNNIVGENESFLATLKGNKKRNNPRHGLFGARTSTEDDDDGFSIDSKSSDGLSTIYSHDNILSLLTTEESNLLPRSKNAHGNRDQQQQQQQGTSRFSVKNAFGNISSLFPADTEGSYEKKLESALQVRDDQILAFDTLYHDEQKSVKSFYYDTLDDLEERFEFMRDSVARAFGIDVYTDKENLLQDDSIMSPSPRDRHRVSPFTTQRKHHRKTLSMDGVMESFLHHHIIGDDTSTGISVRNDGTRKTTRKTHNSSPYMRTRKQRIKTKEELTQKSHRRGVTNIQLGDLSQDDEDDDDDDELRFQSANINSKKDGHGDVNNDPELEEKRIADAEMIKRFLVSQYRIAKYLHNYAMLNITGFVKIVKKFDKNVPSCAGKFKTSLEARNMMDDAEDVETLIKKYETNYANWFCEGDTRAAKVQMLSKQRDGLEMDWSQLQLGYRMGVCAVLAVWVCWDCVWGLVKNGYSTIGERAAFPIFRACGGLLLLQWYWGCSVFVWTRYRINYIFLFDFVPSTISTPFDIFCAAVDNTLLFMMLMLLYYKSGSHDIPQFIPTGVYPLLLIFITIWKLVFPLRQRKPLWQAILKVICAPLHSPTFFHTYVGDVFTSIVKILQDIAWSICWVYAGNFLASEDSDTEDSDKGVKQEWSKTFWYKTVLIPLITMAPLVIRFNQCLRKFWDTGDRFPHLANAAKYVSSLLVTLFGIFHPLYLEYGTGKDLKVSMKFYQIFWTFLFVVTSIYAFIWDVYMDFGLGLKQYSYLNQPLMYPQKSYYYTTIGIDLVLRFLWVLTLVPPDSGASFALPEYLTALVMMLELSRRTLWGFFRLENEHRNNEHKYRRAGFVPLHFNTGHKHMYQNKKERPGSEVLREVIFVTLVVGVFCFATIAAAQHANQRYASYKEL